MDIFIFVQIAILILSVILHELGHGYAALALGDSTAKQQGRPSFNPAHHIDPFFTIILPLALVIMGMPAFGGAKPVPVNPNHFKFTSARRGMMIVAAAGPLVNLSLALLALTFIHLGYTLFPNMLTASFIWVLIINLILMIFNLIPIPPLDGSKVLIGLLPRELAFKWAMLERYGLFLIFALVLFGAFQPMLNLCLSFATSLLPDDLFNLRASAEPIY